MFYYHFKNAIQRSGLTYRAVASGASIDLSTLVRLSQAKTSEDYNLSLRSLDSLCQFMKCRPEDIITYKKK